MSQSAASSSGSTLFARPCSDVTVCSIFIWVYIVCQTLLRCHSLQHLHLGLHCLPDPTQYHSLQHLYLGLHCLPDPVQMSQSAASLSGSTLLARPCSDVTVCTIFIWVYIVCQTLLKCHSLQHLHLGLHCLPDPDQMSQSAASLSGSTVLARPCSDVIVCSIFILVYIVCQTLLRCHRLQHLYLGLHCLPDPTQMPQSAASSSGSTLFARPCSDVTVCSIFIWVYIVGQTLLRCHSLQHLHLGLHCLPDPAQMSQSAASSLLRCHCLQHLYLGLHWWPDPAQMSQSAASLSGSTLFARPYSDVTVCSIFIWVYIGGQTLLRCHSLQHLYLGLHCLPDPTQMSQSAASLSGSTLFVRPYSDVTVCSIFIWIYIVCQTLLRCHSSSIFIWVYIVCQTLLRCHSLQHLYLGPHCLPDPTQISQSAASLAGSTLFARPCSDVTVCSIFIWLYTVCQTLLRCHSLQHLYLGLHCLPDPTQTSVCSIFIWVYIVCQGPLGVNHPVATSMPLQCIYS